MNRRDLKEVEQLDLQEKKKKKRKETHCENGSAWHPVCHHSNDGNYSQQGGASPFPGQVSGSSVFSVFAIVDFVVLLPNH